MKISVECRTVQDLWEVSGLSVDKVASALGISPSSVYLKVSGRRPWFEDEIGPVAVVLSCEDSRVSIDETKLIKLIGAKNVKRRGFLA